MLVAPNTPSSIHLLKSDVMGKSTYIIGFSSFGFGPNNDYHIWHFSGASYSFSTFTQICKEATKRSLIHIFIIHCFFFFYVYEPNQHTCGSILFLMKDPCAPIFVFSREVFSLFTVLMPGLNKCKIRRSWYLLCNCAPVYKKGIVQNMVVVAQRAHLVTLKRFNTNW